MYKQHIVISGKGKWFCEFLRGNRNDSPTPNKLKGEKLNPEGGAIALGHPLGATGKKLLTSMIYRMERNNQRYGLLAICEGMGMANATIIERI